MTSLFDTTLNKMPQESQMELNVSGQLWRRTISVSLCLVIVMALMALPLSYAINRHLDAISTTTGLRHLSDHLILKIIEQTEAERSFFLTRDKKEEENFQQDTKIIEETLQSLDSIARQDPRWNAWFQDVKLEVLRRNEILRELIDISQFLPIVEKPQTNPAIEEKIRTGEITKLILSFLEEEEHFLKANYEQLSQLRAILNYLALAVIIMTLILAYFINQRLKRDVIQLKSYQDQLAQENVALEERVKKRTNELQIATQYAEKERQRAEFLLQDASHRIGNSLATVSSLLSLQINQSKNAEVKSALAAARDHIQTIATAHRRLRLSQDMDTADTKDFFETVIKDIELSLSPEKREHIVFETKIQSLKIRARDATTLAIITSELVINATKHAFKPHQKGKIKITLTEHDSNIVNLIIEDNGKGFPTNMAASKSLGYLIISNLCKQFDTKPLFENIDNSGGRVTLALKNIIIAQSE